MSQAAKEQALRRVFGSENWKKTGRAKFSAGGPEVHTRYCSPSSSDSDQYKFNINENTLSADFELWVCGDDKNYYLIPMNVIEEMYNHPDAYTDSYHPNMTIVSVYTDKHEAMYARGSTKIGLEKYHRAILDGNGLDRSTPVAEDASEPPERTKYETYRILRDTQIARKVKEENRHKCQLCGKSIELADGRAYAEAHHVKPLSQGGPDSRDNIICVCPNHHVKLDYYAIRLDKNDFPTIKSKFIEYHNDKFMD